ILTRFSTPNGLVREEGWSDLDSSAAWAATVFPQPVLRLAVRATLLTFVRDSTPYGIAPMEGWTPGEVWTASTAWSAWALVELGEIHPADRLLGELHRAETAAGTLPERVDSADGHPTSTTPLAWSHAFAILVLRARYPGYRPDPSCGRRPPDRERRPRPPCARRSSGRPRRPIAPP